MTLIEQLNKGKLKETEYPTTMSNANFNGRPNEIIIFMVGGVTFEEAREVSLIQNQQVFLGGTTVHNTKSFLAEISQINFDKNNSVNINMENAIVGKNYSGYGKMN